jgi:6-phosphogluconolactonase (cycloisomerase 2 family)
MVVGFDFPHSSRTPGSPPMRRIRRLLASLCIGAALPLFGCGGGGIAGTQATSILYTESNDPTQNTLLAFTRASDGTLTPLPGSPFDLKGQGLANDQEMLGPPDADQQVIINPNHTFLFAVNQGSNTIAVQRINGNGTLTPVAGSPFASGGVNPSSLALVGSRLYCANKNVASATAGGTPNYTTFNVGSDGTLTQVASATVTSPVGSSAAQILSSPDGATLFTNDFFAPTATPATGSLRSFHVNANGTLTQVGPALTVPSTPPAGTAPAFIPLYKLTQGLQVHPIQRILYACTPISSNIAVYTYDSGGQLTFHSFAHTSGVASCWLTIDRSATRMYVVSTGDDSVSVMDITNATAPVELQRIQLKDSAPTFPPPLPILPPLTSSAGAEEALDPSGQFLYVVSSRLNPAASFHGGDFLHILKVNADGTLTEPGNSVNLTQSDRAHPQGLVVF